MVYYRKYRPQKIDDLDNTEVRQKLTAILTKDIPHAFLFTGPKGLGKTSTARIVAKVINCEGRGSSVQGAAKKELDPKTSTQNLNLEPCNECVQCISITEGSNLDVVEIDAASNRGIDEIRELKDNIRLAPLSAQKKVYIIDEVHMLTTEAFNALLKTLEEPPTHVVFILCTTELHKVPATILSRSFHIGFHLATPEELVRSFKRIVTGESIEADDEGLLAIAQLAEGGFRDGAKIFEEVVALANNQKITQKLVEEIYQLSGVDTQVVDLLQAFAQRDIKQGMMFIASLVTQGTDLKHFLSLMVEVLHKELLRRNGIGEKQPEKFGELTLAELIELLRIINTAQFEMKTAILAQLPIELALVEWSAKHISPEATLPQSTATAPVKETIPDANTHKNTVEVTTETVKISTEDEVTMGSLRKQAGNIAKIRALYGDSAGQPEKKDPIVTTDLTLSHISNDKEITKEWLDEFWRCLISEIKAHNHTLAGVLRGCMLKSFDRKSVVIETSFTFHKEKLDDAKTKQLLEQVSKSLTGLPVMVAIELKSN